MNQNLQQRAEFLYASIYIQHWTLIQAENLRSIPDDSSSISSRTAYQGTDGVKKCIRQSQRNHGKVHTPMSNEAAERMVNTGVAGADRLKIQTAEALEDAARKLRAADVSAKGDDVKHILQNVEDRVNQFKADVGAGYHKVEADYHKRVEPVEHVIIDHPIPAVLIAAGVGVLIGMLIFKSRD